MGQVTVNSVIVDALCESISTRVREIMGSHSAEEFGRSIGCSGETVRRYLHGPHPHLRVPVALCVHHDVNGHWLLVGRGPRLESDRWRAILSDAPTDVFLAEFQRRFHMPQPPDAPAA